MKRKIFGINLAYIWFHIFIFDAFFSEGESARRGRGQMYLVAKTYKKPLAMLMPTLKKHQLIQHRLTTSTMRWISSTRPCRKRQKTLSISIFGSQKLSRYAPIIFVHVLANMNFTFLIIKG